MSKMRTFLKTMKKGKRLLIAVLALTVLIGTAGLVTAFAAGDYYSTSPAFDIRVAGDPDERDGFIAKSTDEDINFRADGVFSADTPKWVEGSGWNWGHYDYGETYLNKIKAFKIVAHNMGEDTPVKIQLDESATNKWKLSYDSGTNTTTITYIHSGGTQVDANTFNSLMALVEVTFDKDAGFKSSDNTYVTIQAYNGTAMRDKDVIGQNRNGGGAAMVYTCKFTFYGYAEGTVDEDSSVVDYKNSFASSYDSNYEEDVPAGAAADDVYYTQDDSGNGKVNFNMRLTDLGTSSSTSAQQPFGYRAEVGYQIKRSNEGWTSSIPVTFVQENGSNKYINLRTWDLNTEIPIEVTGLEPNVSYNIRGVVVTDSKYDSPKYTSSELVVSYRPPVINSFTSVGTGKVFRGGTDTVQMSMLATMNDINSRDVTYTENASRPGSEGDSEYTGPALRAQVYFTMDRKLDTETVDGEEVYTNDRSVWYKFGGASVGRLQKEDGEITTSMNYKWASRAIPATIGEATGATVWGQLTDESGEPQVDGEGNPVYGNVLDPTPIDSKNCAFKLVVTDLYTGYSTYTYSELFSIDAKPPTGMQIEASDPLNPGSALHFDLDNAETSVVGGSGAQVRINIGGADDGAGSGIKEYRYAMYYLSTEDAARLNKSTRGEILNEIAKYDSSSHGRATYTPWTTAADAQQYDSAGSPVLDSEGNPVLRANWGEILVSKDGYYRIDAVAVDNADYQTEPVSAYFQVDLSSPNTPEVYLSKQRNASTSNPAVIASPLTTLEGYDGRTYTQSEVWAAVYSAPKTGKTVQYFNYSLDGGLTWLRLDQKQVTDASGNVSVVANVDNAGDPNYVLISSGQTGKVPTYVDGNYTSTQTMTYQALLCLTGMGISDYQSIIFRAVDQLGNPSLASAPAVVRITPEPVRAVGSMTHDPIEVALALGNTKIKPAQIIPALKNAAAKKMNIKMFGESSAEYNLIKNHTCTWDDKVGFTGECNQSNCPYKTNEEYYTPSLVNIQGISEGSAQEDVTAWKRYDHTDFSGSVKSISYEGAVTQISGYASGTHLSEASSDYGVGYFDPVNASNPSGGSKCMYRYNHIIDMSGSRPVYSEILFVGTSKQPIEDWLFLHNDQSLPKTMIFTMDTGACHFHTYVTSGFWFNTTIRQKYNTSGAWVISGYRLALVRSGNWKITDCTGGTSNADMVIQKFTDVDVQSLMANCSHSTGTQLVAAGLSGTGNRVQNFMIITDGDNVKVYKTEGAGNNKEENFIAYDGDTSKLIINYNGCSNPTVNGVQIGTKGTAYNDTDCFGFGPFIGYSSHSCYIETRVTFSDISMKMQKGKTLSEVVNEPMWGNGKAKFILNLSDDAERDFQDPALTSMIQWRLNTDKARYIGWGIAANKADTDKFLLRLAGENATAEEIARYGMYETTTPAFAQQIDDIAVYMTTQYFTEFGYTGSGTIKDQLQAGSAKKGNVYSINDIGNMKLSVTPTQYNTSTANPDFPAGRWYMVHDITGVNTQKDVRSDAYSDALNTEITLPGRYTFYFAPEKSDVDNGTLDPSTAVFDFVVNQPPEARFVGTLSSDKTTVSIQDTSQDPDAPSGPQYAKGTSGSVQISGITKREFRYELLSSHEVSGEKVLDQLYTSDWQTMSLNGKTLTQLTGGKYTSVPDGAVLTVYERVTDISAVRKADKDASGKVTGYHYEQTTSSVSEVCQQNVSANISVTDAPNSSITLDKVYLYDTSRYASAENQRVVVTRNSSHPQGKDFALSWLVSLGTSYKQSGRKDNLIELVEDTSTGNWKLPSGVTKNGAAVSQDVVLTCITRPTYSGRLVGTMKESKGGQWAVSYSFLEKYVEKDNMSVGLGLRIVEQSYGISAASAALGSTQQSYIQNYSARTIFYRSDTTAPSSQVVTTRTYTKQTDGSYQDQEYEASNYLDVTNRDKYIQVNISGSADTEGRLKGYAYYFYEKSASGAENKWYKQNSNGSLTQVSSQSAALAQIESIPANNQVSFRISRETMNLQEAAGRPTASLNVAIFAYDYPAGGSGIGNRTAVTRIEDIKLTTSIPMPPEIVVTNATNDIVAKIGNQWGYDNASTLFPPTDPSYSLDPSDENYTGPDVQYPFTMSGGTKTLQNYTNTNVTIQFNPRIARYDKIGGELILNESGSGTEYYQDIFLAADLTATANIQYEIYRSDREASSMDRMTLYMSSDSLEKGYLDASQPLTITEDGFYWVRAWVVNGAHTRSREYREVKFVVDKIAPDGDESTEGTVDNVQVKFSNGSTFADYRTEWAQSVVMDITRASDLNATTAHFEYTTDGGKTWTVLDGSILTDKRITFDKTGEYSVRVRAVDRAGNETYNSQSNRTVRIDRDYPITPAPTLTATVTTKPMYAEYMADVSDAQGGKISVFLNGVENTENTLVAIPNSSNATFRFKPDAGREVSAVTVVYGGVTTNYTVESSAMVPVGDGQYDLTVSGVVEDLKVSALFTEIGGVSSASSYMARSRSATGQSSVAVTAQEDEGGSDAPLDEETYTVVANGQNGVRAVVLNDGSITSDFFENVASGTEMDVTITLYDGFRMKSISVNGVEQTFGEEGATFLKTKENTYTGRLTITRSTTIVATGEQIPTRVLSLTCSHEGSAYVDTSGANNIKPITAGKYSVQVGSKVKFVMTPDDPDHYVPQLTIDGGTPYTLTEVEYTVPEYTGEGEDPGISAKVTFEVKSDKFYEIPLILENIDDDGPHGSVQPVSETSAGKVIKVPYVESSQNGTRRLILTPDLHYKVASVKLSYWDDEIGATRTRELSGNVDAETGELILNIGGDIDQINQNSSLTVRFQMKTYSINLRYKGSGTVEYLYDNPDVVSRFEVPEGTTVTLVPKPRDGYVVKGLSGTVGGLTYSQGSMSTYVLKELMGRADLELTFEPRALSGNSNAHAITAVANKVNDAHDRLADRPYSFKIATLDGTYESAWTEPAAQNTYTFTNIVDEITGRAISLQPNTEYRVYLRTVDQCGNASPDSNEKGAISSTIHTMANIPNTNGAEAVNALNEYDKSVALNVKTNGNPDDTEYLVYYSEKNNMEGMKIANESVNGGWKTLTAGQFIIDGLTPGVKYWLQVVARNSDGYSTSPDPNDIISVTVSPASPPANSFYFEDQASPVDPITLHWEEPVGNVTGIRIYRDNVPLIEIKGTDQRSYVDAYTSFAGDHIGTYSYAFINDAGVGSPRVAVSQDYYLASEDASLGDEHRALLDAMDALVATNNNEFLFSQAMTYPRFPVKLEDPVAGCADTAGAGVAGDHSGTITITVSHDTSNPDVDTERYSKYWLRLEAFRKTEVVNEDGTTSYTYTQVDDDVWDNNGKNNRAAKATKVNNNNGATVSWTDLATEFEYQVFVDKVQSNGYRDTAAKDGYGGQTKNVGVEGLLGRVMTVTPTGYSIEYTSDTAKGLQAKGTLPNKSGTWADLGTSKADLYVAGYEKGWDSSLYGENYYIAFNKTPHVKLASDPYADAANNGKVFTDAQGQYILLDDTSGDMNFSLRMVAWDTDGVSDHALPYVNASVTGTSLTSGKQILNETNNLAKTEEAAEGSPYTMVFDASGLPTGIYESVQLMAFDGDTEANQTANVRIVVNRTTPIVTSAGSGSRQVEIGSAFDLSQLGVNTRLREESNLSVQKSQNRVALMVMPERFDAELGSHDLTVLENTLWKGTATDSAGMLAKAKALLGSDASNSRYVQSSGLLTEDGLHKALGRVSPPYDAYLTITEEQYNTYKDDPANGGKVRKDVNNYVNPPQTLYWAEAEFAVENDLCQWLTNENGTTEVVNDEALVDRKFSVSLVTNFGNNTATTTVAYQPKRAPMVSIVSHQVIGWTPTKIKDEYEVYSRRTIQDVIDETAKITTAEINLDGSDPTDPAAKIVKDETTGKDVMKVFQLSDSKALVSRNSISANVSLEFGTYSRFDEVGVLFTTDHDFNPNTATVFPDDLSTCIVTRSNGSTIFPNTGSLKNVFSFYQSGLEPGQVYYLWSYFKIHASGDQPEMIKYDRTYIALATTDDYKRAYYGFEYRNDSFEEPAGSETQRLGITVQRMGDSAAVGTVQVTAEYLQADQFGNVLNQTNPDGTPVLDAEGDPVPLKLEGEQLEWAKKVLHFEDESPTMEFDTDGTPPYYVPMQLSYVNQPQGHMVVRLRMEVLESKQYYCYTMPGQETIDLFVLDRDSPVLTYKLGVYNTRPETGEKIMDENVDEKTGEINYYSYQYPGLQVNYQDLSNNELRIYYSNVGTGDLENITATVTLDEEGSTPTDIFEVGLPTQTSLLAGLEVGQVPYVTVRPARGLEDGVYTAWVTLKADNVSPADYVKVRIQQVVGQSTLKGRIYITPGMPTDKETPGVATIYLYDAARTTYTETTDAATGRVIPSFSQKPMYTVKTDESGFYQIDNILNDYSYCIVVEREGYVTYNGVRRYNGSYHRQLVPTSSAVYEFNLRLLGGDINGDLKVTESDRLKLIEYYNTHYDRSVEATTDQEKERRRCDFNRDGVINALDRAFLIGNMGSTMDTYGKSGLYGALSPVTE